MWRVSFLLIILLNVLCASAQISTTPAIPTATQKVTITFDSSKESQLGYYTGDLYAHTGLITNKSTSDTDWKYVIESWGNNSQQPKLTYKGNGIYEMEITPSINSFYSVLSGEKVVKLAFVFRTADANKQTNNLYVNVYEEGLVVEISQPSENAILQKNQSVTISAQTSVESSIKLFLNETLLTQTTGKAISVNHTFTESGNYWLIATATSGNETKTDSVSVFVRENVQVQTKPLAYRKGINYPTDTSAALVLWAPLKEFVFVVGDFNNWKTQNEFQMKKDGDYFWLEIPGLEKGKEYIFQYLVDGKIKVADPYSEKISDPWNDKYIQPETYQNLIQYPENKTSGIASVLQTGQEQYQWEIDNFSVPDKNKLVIYELLIRDFAAEHTYKAVREKLDYLEDLNINVLELMPVNEFEGNSSWGYNPSFYFAPDKYYGPKNELKKLIDECHKRGIAVVIDMVLNHSYGQSPFVQMYIDNWTITAENPWFNITSPNQTYSWGYDFNHEAAVVEELVDSVNSFWMNEYKVDGFRFDFTKGFTNTPGDGWAYDAPRISNLKRMADQIWKRKNGALVILEHLSDNSEEKELANYGMLLWGNMHGSYKEAARGNVGNSNLNWGIFSNRGWSEPNLVTYPESHDEERIMFVCIQSGYTNGDYNIKQLTVALDRIELNAVFHIPLPGPKMIWQFGERGYDVSINDFGGRLSEKPPRWEYLENRDRTDLFKVTAKLNYLKQAYNEFSPDNFNYSLTGEIKWYATGNGSNHVFAVGNFATSEKTASVTFPVAGKWFDFFKGDSILVNTPPQNFSLAPGEYRLYSTRKFNSPRIITEISDIEIQERSINVFPNPASNEITISSKTPISQIEIYSLTGNLLHQSGSVLENIKKIDIRDFPSGVYLVHINQEKDRTTKKIMVK